MTTQLDPVSVAIALAGVLFGPALASVIGPFIGCTVGEGWVLMDVELLTAQRKSEIAAAMQVA